MIVRALRVLQERREMPTAEKAAVVQDLADILKRSKGIYLTDFTGLDVPAFTRLRRRLSEGAVSYRVVKNRLAFLAAKEAGVEGLNEMFRGPTGLVFTENDPIAPARLLSEFARETQGRPKLKVGLVEGRTYVEDELEALALLPSREVLLGQVVTGIQGPLSGLVLCLQGVLQNFVIVLQAIAEKKKEASGGEAASDAP